ATLAVRTRSGLKPNFVSRKRVKVLSRSPAPISSTNASETSATTSKLRKRWCDLRHRSDFASLSLEMTSHFRQIHSSLRDFTIEIGGSIQSDEIGIRLSVQPPPDRIASRARSDAQSPCRPGPRRPVRAASDSPAV